VPAGVYVVEVNQVDLAVAVPVPVAVPAIVPDGVYVVEVNQVDLAVAVAGLNGYRSLGVFAIGHLPLLD